jgi:hypothetical protein
MRGNCFVLLCAFFALVICQLGFVSASLCTDNCDQTKTAGSLVTWCGTDGQTHTTTQSAITLDGVSLSSDCYSLCGISVKHVGACGCPNDCYNETGNGYCDTVEGVCKCADAFKGADCSSVKCPQHTCSGHGTCKKQDANKGDDFCICQNGWTGYDCSVKIPQPFIDQPYGSLPFGEHNSSLPYYLGEEDGDRNPLFNTSVLATIRVTLDEEDLTYLLRPENRRIVEYVDAKMFFDNGLISTYMDIEFRIKGLSSRMLSKKSWNIKLDKKWHDVKGFSMKAPPSDRTTTFPLIAEMARAMNAQTYRTNLATLFVNGWYYGVMMMHEKLDDKFMKSRFNVDDTNMYQLGATFYGDYWGSVSTPYQEFAPAVFDDIPIPGITQEEGTGVWDDLTMLVTVLNSTHQARPYLEKYFDREQFLRTTAIDFATDNFDSYYGTGNNYMWVNTGGFDNPHWIHFGIDFDNAFKSPYSIAGYLGMTPAQLETLLLSGVTHVGGFDLAAYALNPNPYVINNRPGRPVANGVYLTPGTNETFTRIMTDLIRRLIFDRPGTLQARRQAYYDISRSMLYRDKMFTLPGFGMAAGPATLESAFHNSTLAWMNKKYSFLGSLFVAGGHGQCDALANCVCDPNYSGPTCQTYTPPPPPTPAPCSASTSLTVRDTWVSSGQTWATYDITLTNTGSLTLSGVTVSLSGNPIDSKWNMNSVGGNQYSLTIWAGIAPGGSSVGQYGFIAVGNTNNMNIGVTNVSCN